MQYNLSINKEGVINKSIVIAFYSTCISFLEKLDVGKNSNSWVLFNARIEESKLSFSGKTIEEFKNEFLNDTVYSSLDFSVFKCGDSIGFDPDFITLSYFKGNIRISIFSHNKAWLDDSMCFIEKEIDKLLVEGNSSEENQTQNYTTNKPFYKDERFIITTIIAILALIISAIKLFINKS